MLNQRVVRSNAMMTRRGVVSLLLAVVVLAPSVAEASGPFAYITNSNDNTVSVVDTSSNTVTATVPVGVAPSGVAVTVDGTRVYVGNSFDGTVSVIATASNTVTARLSMWRIKPTARFR